MAFNFRSLQDVLRERLLAHIAAGELTGVQLARETGFQQAHISNFLNRKRGLSLEAMDLILRARHISLSELVPEAKPVHRRRRAEKVDSCECLTVPIVQEQNCAATQVPKPSPREVIKLAPLMVQTLRPDMHTPRPHWQRFLGLRIKPADAMAMSPRLQRGAIVVVDRHYNALTPWKHERNMYLVRSGNDYLARYVEAAGNEFLLRPHDPDHPLLPLRSDPGHDPLSAIIGRICFVHLHV